VGRFDSLQCIWFHRIGNSFVEKLSLVGPSQLWLSERLLMLITEELKNGTCQKSIRAEVESLCKLAKRFIAFE